MAERGKRYEKAKRGWAYDTPKVDIQWDCTVISVEPANHVLGYVCGKTTRYISYDVLIWTAPLNVLFGALGFDPTTLTLSGRPIYYSCHVEKNDGYIKDQIVVEYVPDESTPVYRRSIYYTEATISVSIESMQHLDGFQQFWPGKIDASDEAQYLEVICKAHDIVLAGRFARWDPDELTHHTAERLRSVLK